MFGKRHGEVHTLATVLKDLRTHESYIDGLLDEVGKKRHQVNILEARLSLLMDYLNVRIESGDRIVPKDNAQG